MHGLSLAFVVHGGRSGGGAGFLMGISGSGVGVLTLSLPGGGIDIQGGRIYLSTSMSSVESGSCNTQDFFGQAPWSAS